MSIAKTIEISADSESGFDDAVRQGVQAACRTLENVHSVWVKDQEVQVEGGNISRYRVWLKVTFALK